MMRRLRTALWALTAATALLGALSASSQAKAPIDALAMTPSTTQAGGHPDIKLEVSVGNRATQGYSNPCFCDDPKEVVVNFPTGVIGNPHVTPQCSASQFAAAACPVDSQVGTMALLLGGPLSSGGQYWIAPLYNMIPSPGEAGLLEFPAPIFGYTAPQFISLKGRTGGDFGLTATLTGLERFVPVYTVQQYLWGVPADAKHDALRQYFTGCGFTDVIPALDAGEAPIGCKDPNPVPSNSPLLPFLSNPTRCGVPLSVTVDTFSFDHGTDNAEAPYPTITGCDQLVFNPSLSAKPTTTEADSAAGIDIDLKVPQVQSPATPSPSQIREASVALPRGFSINPNAADGKIACLDAQANFGNEDAANCPEFSKIGTTTIDSSALPGPIDGFMYLGEPRAGDRYRVIVTGDGFATHMKLTGSLLPDPETGQLVTRFSELPQSPLTEFKLHIFGSERGSLATPTQCGTYAVRSTFVPWDAALPVQNATQFFNIDSGPGGQPCPPSPREFGPDFSAASVGNTGGAHTPFGIELSRPDGNQVLAGITVTTPPGFAATLRGIPYCPQSALDRLGSEGYAGLAELAATACPPASQIGTAVTGAGAGSRPIFVEGQVYLAGPYKGSPLSLVVVIPAVSGPYDLGTIAIRSAISVDPLTAQVTTTSDPFPQILEGIPLRTRMLKVNLDRPGFALNPTNCDQLSVEATAVGDEGAAVRRSSGFQVANCARLPFRPRVEVKMSGATRRRGHPAIHAVVRTKLGEANPRVISVTLPKGQLIDNAHLKAICSRVEFTADTCPEGSRIGTVEASTPILEQPLRGSVFLRSSSSPLPDMVLDLHGQIDFTAVARIDSLDGRLRTTFEAVPDVPLGSVALDLAGGAKGLLQNSRSLCGRQRRSKVRMTGQNGVTVVASPRIRVACKGSGRKQRASKKGDR